MVDRAKSFLMDLLMRFDTRSAEVALGLCLWALAVGSLLDEDHPGPGMIAWLLGMATHVSAYSGNPHGRRMVNAMGAAFWIFEVSRNVHDLTYRTLLMYLALAFVSSLVSIRAAERRGLGVS